ncbi:hypothetical protein GOODEAATRI_032441 [Goodea atripinnis]|uniref:Secreted protein n=1 Tax=Goodea atripinnis TaxID=208336 RepID=A0ABV0PTW7_9TELE
MMIYQCVFALGDAVVTAMQTSCRTRAYVVTKLLPTHKGPFYWHIACFSIRLPFLLISMPPSWPPWQMPEPSLEPRCCSSKFLHFRPHLPLCNEDKGVGVGGWGVAVPAAWHS